MLTEKLGQLLAGAAMLVILALLVFTFSSYAPLQGSFAAQKGATPTTTEQLVATPNVKSTIDPGLHSVDALPLAPGTLETVVALNPAPTTSPQERDQVLNARIIESLYAEKGITISQGTNQKPIGRWHIKTYRVEEVNLAKPVSSEVDGKDIEITKYWLLTITGDFGVLNSLPKVLIDGVYIGLGYAPDLKEMKTLIFDRALLREGASIVVSYGGETTLPEKLHVSSK